MWLLILVMKQKIKNKKWKKRNVLIIDTHCERKKLWSMKWLKKKKLIIFKFYLKINKNSSNIFKGFFFYLKKARNVIISF